MKSRPSFAEFFRGHRPAAERVLPRFGRGALGRGGRPGSSPQMPENGEEVNRQECQE